jgi:hypothetical protein
MTDTVVVVSESSVYLTQLIDTLSTIYDQLYSQDADIEDLGNAIDAIVFANQKLQEQKLKLEEQRKELRSKISSAYGDQEQIWEREKQVPRGLRRPGLT